MELELKPDVKIMFVFVAMAIVLGVVNGLLDISARIGALIGLALFYVSFKVSPETLSEEELESYDTSAWNILKTGVLPYWFLLLVSWTLIFSINFY